MTNHQIDPNSLFGRVALVFFWGGLAAVIVTMLDAFLHLTTIHALWLAVGVNMFLVWAKNEVMRRWNR